MATPTEIATAKGGTAYALLYENVDVYTTVMFDSSNWNQGLLENASFAETLHADTEDGGSWTNAIPIEALVNPSVGIYVSWIGQGVTVSYSTDNENWTQLENHRTILEDVDTTGLFLYLRIDLDDDLSELESLLLDILGERIMQPVSGERSMTFKGVSFDETEGDFEADSGASIRNGYLIIDEHADIPVRTVEMWARFSDTVGYLVRYASSNYARLETGSTMAISGLTAYRNGAPLTNGTVVPQNQWDHYVFVFPADVLGEIKIGNNVANDNPLNFNVGHLAVYDTAMTAGEVASLYAINLNPPVIRVNDVSRIVVTESSPVVDIYAYDWSIVSA